MLYLLKVSLFFTILLCLHVLTSPIEIVDTAVTLHRAHDVHEAVFGSRTVGQSQGELFHFHEQELPYSRVDTIVYDILFDQKISNNKITNSTIGGQHAFEYARLLCGKRLFEQQKDMVLPSLTFEWNRNRAQYKEGDLFSASLTLPHDRWKSTNGLEHLHPSDCTIHFPSSTRRSFGTLYNNEIDTINPFTVEFSQGCKRKKPGTLSVPRKGTRGPLSPRTRINAGLNVTHKEAVLALSPVKFSQLLSVYTQLVDYIVDETTLFENISAVNYKERGSSGRTLLTKDHTASDQTALLGAVEALRTKTLVKMGMHAGELYEIIIKPLATALGKQLPFVLFQLVKFPIAVLLRDVMTSGLKEPMTIPVLNQLDPSSMFGAGSEMSPADVTAAHGTARMSAGIADDIGLQVTDSVISSLTKALWHKMESRMSDIVAGQASRQVSRVLLVSLTHTLTQSISRGLIEIFSTSLTKYIARGVNKALIPTLTYSLAPTITHSLMHHPQIDFFCFFCEKEKIYCEYCRAGHEHAAKQDYYISYYMAYYTSYYADSYSSYLSDRETENYFATTGQMH
jgi:hypothetical protein